MRKVSSDRAKQPSLKPKAKPERRETSIEKGIVIWLKNQDCLTRKMNGLGFRDWPDRECFTNFTNVPLWLEVKKPGYDATDSQAILHGILRERGHEVFVVHSLDEAKAAYQSFKNKYAKGEHCKKCGTLECACCTSDADIGECNSKYPNCAMRAVPGNRGSLALGKPVRGVVVRSRLRKDRHYVDGVLVAKKSQVD